MANKKSNTISKEIDKMNKKPSTKKPTAKSTKQQPIMAQISKWQIFVNKFVTFGKQFIQLVSSLFPVK